MYTMEQIDNLSGLDFENVAADILFHNGYRRIEVTKGSGDYGIDIIAYRNNVKYGIQCKRYSSKVSNKAVQEASSGSEFYHCQGAMVLTNNYFTKAAITTADEIGVRLYDRDKLQELLDNYDESYDEYDKEAATYWSETTAHLRNNNTGIPVKKTSSVQKPINTKTTKTASIRTKRKPKVHIQIHISLPFLIFIIFFIAAKISSCF